jgi:hypothetical protein
MQEESSEEWCLSVRRRRREREREECEVAHKFLCGKAISIT